MQPYRKLTLNQLKRAVQPALATGNFQCCSGIQAQSRQTRDICEKKVGEVPIVRDVEEHFVSRVAVHFPFFLTGFVVAARLFLVAVLVFLAFFAATRRPRPFSLSAISLSVNRRSSANREGDMPIRCAISSTVAIRCVRITGFRIVFLFLLYTFGPVWRGLRAIHVAMRDSTEPHVLPSVLNSPAMNLFAMRFSVFEAHLQTDCI
jgi:hypothetical protein